MVSNTHQADSKPFELNRGARRFPQHLLRPSRSGTYPVRHIEPTAREDQVPAGLRDAICERLPWNSLAPTESSRDAIIAAYIASLDLLKAYCHDVDHFLTEACFANLEFRQSSGTTNAAARDQVLKSKLQTIHSYLPESWSPIHNVLDARLASLPVPELRWRLEESLGTAVAGFTQQLFDRLALLVDRQVFGLVEWLPNHVCLYHYYKQVVIQDNLGASERVVDQVFRDSQRRDPQTGQRVVGAATVEITRHGTHQHRIARHEHHVINAIRTTPANSSVVYPLEVQRLLTKIPAWLYPFIEVIDGRIVGERVIERDTAVEPWKDTEREVVPIYGCEPGIIIGPYVLTGWGPRDVEQELQRRAQEASQRSRQAAATSAGWQLPWLVTTSVFAAGLALVVTALAELRRQPRILSIVTTIVAALLIWSAAQTYSRVNAKPNGRLLSGLATVLCVGLLLLLECGLIAFSRPVGWLLPLGLVAMTLVAWIVASWLHLER